MECCREVGVLRGVIWGNGTTMGEGTISTKLTICVHPYGVWWGGGWPIVGGIGGAALFET